MATKQFWILTTTAVTPNWFGFLQDGGTAPTAAVTAYGWTPGTTAIGFYRSRLGASGKANVQSATTTIDGLSSPTKGTSSGSAGAGDSWITPSTYAGTFAAGNWSFSIGLRPSVITCTGRLRFKVYASVNADGSSARTLTSSTLVTNIVALNSTTTTVIASVTWAAPAVTLVNEYLFFQCEWEETTIGTAGTSALGFRVSEASITTTDFVLSAIGTLAATDVTDTSAVTGSVRWLGTLAATENNEITADSEVFTCDDNVVLNNDVPGDNATFAGDVGAAAITGTLAATGGADTAAFAGTVLALSTGTLAATEATDTASFTGNVAFVPVTGTLAATEARDASSFSGGIIATGTLAATEQQDTASFSGGVIVAGVLAATENRDTTSFTGLVRWTGVLAATEGAADTFAASGFVISGPSGVLAAVEGTSGPTADSTLLRADSTTVTVDEYHSIGADTAHFTGTLGLLGVLRAFEHGTSSVTADSTLVTADNTLITADTTYASAGDAASFAGTVTGLVGTMDAIESGVRVTADSTQVTADSTVYTADRNYAGGDQASFSGTVVWLPIPGVLGAVEQAQDAAWFTWEPQPIDGILAAIERQDIAHFGLASWEDLEEGRGLENEVLRTLALRNEAGRITYIPNEIIRTMEL